MSYSAHMPSSFGAIPPGAMAYCMRGTIRAKGRCQNCGGTYQKDSLLCGCGRQAQRGIYIDLSWGKPSRQLKVYADRRQVRFMALQHARDTLGLIRSEIMAGAFDPANYIAREQKELLWPNWCRTWERMQEARVAREDLSSGSLKMYQAHLRNHIATAEQFRNRDIREIRALHLQAFLDSLDRKRLSANTKANVFAVLRLMFSDAERLEVVDRKPRFPPIHRPDPEHYRPTEEEREAIFRQIPEAHRPVFTFLRYQPVRPIEACRLQHRHVHLEDPSPWALIPKRIRKAGKTYTQPLHSAVAAMLRALPRRGLYVFLHEDGRPYTPDQLGHIWADARERAEHPDPTLYESTRHHIATEAANAGADIGQIAAALGNTVGMTAKHYVTYRPATLLEIIERPAKKPAKKVARLKKPKTRPAPKKP